MRKYVIFLLLLLLTGCMSINDITDYKVIMNDIVTTDSKLYNMTALGYKYYLPKGINLVNNDDFNQKFIVNNTYMYMYVDIVSYYYKTNNYLDDSCVSCVYYASINNDGKIGYIKVNKQDDDKYLLDVMYNYTKIEVICDYDSLGLMVAYSSSILASISYNDSVVNNIINKNYFASVEKSYDIDRPKDSNTNTLDVLEEYNQYTDTSSSLLPDEKKISNQ